MADMLALWGEQRSARIARIDFGAVPARSSSDIRFRVKNLSSQYTAKQTVVSVEDVTAGAAAQLLLSLDGVNFAATVDLGDIPAAGISPVVTLRRTTEENALIAAHESTIRVHATSWVSAGTLD